MPTFSALVQFCLLLLNKEQRAKGMMRLWGVQMGSVKFSLLDE